MNPIRVNVAPWGDFRGREDKAFTGTLLTIITTTEAGSDGPEQAVSMRTIVRGVVVRDSDGRLFSPRISYIRELHESPMAEEGDNT